MSNGIGTRQNEAKSIEMLAAQRQLYNAVGCLDVINIILLVVLPLAFAIMQEIGAPWSWMRFLSYGLSLSMLLISIFLAKAIRDKKATAASIQLAFDTYVFAMPWDTRLFGKKRNLNAEIAENSKKILDDEKERAVLIDWYTPIVDQMPLEKGIFTCQKESYHWDSGLRKRYRGLAILIIAVLASIIFIIGIVKNEPFQELIMRIVFILPMVRWLVNTINGLNEDLDRLKELDEEFKQVGNTSMSELQMIQKRITEHRKSAVKIPNAIYKLFRNNDEDREHRIATMDVEQQ